jgi:hypothetical protein
MSAAKGLVGLAFVIIAIVFGTIVVQNNLKNVADAEQWTAYEYGVCRYVDGWTEERCLAEGGQVNWPAINGKEAFEKYYGEGKEQWVYGENPRLGLGPYGENG